MSLPQVPMKSASIEVNESAVDFGSWASQDRQTAQVAALGAVEKHLDSTIAGPWMHNWPLLHRNRHTARVHEPHET